MPLMKSSEGKRFSGELRIFISHSRNLTCRLVRSGNSSHEIVLLRTASSPAAFGNCLTHRLPLDRHIHGEASPICSQLSFFSPTSIPAHEEPSSSRAEPRTLCQELRAQESKNTALTHASLSAALLTSLLQQNNICTTHPPSAPLGQSAASCLLARVPPPPSSGLVCMVRADPGGTDSSFCSDPLLGWGGRPSGMQGAQCATNPAHCQPVWPSEAPSCLKNVFCPQFL